jgi:hypothetical protein
MAVTAATSIRWPRARALVRAPVATPLGLAAIMALSVLLRTARFGVGYWIDEGLSVGIADRPLSHIPGTLQQDGSPPLYYSLLHVWIRLLGSSTEPATHALSLLFATLAIPISWLLVRALLGTRPAWIVAVLVAFNPFLTQYAQETRMYALVMCVGMVSIACFTGAFALGRSRRWTVGFAVAQATLLYTHNWALFLSLGLAAAWAVLVVLADPRERRRLVGEGLLAAAIVAVLYAPWVPTLLFQTAHTGAPWANPPGIDDLITVPGRLLGPVAQFVLIIGAGAGVAALLREPVRRWRPEARAALALLVAVLLTVLVPWVMSQASPAWAARYLSVAVAPLLLLATLGLANAGRLGLVALALTAAISLGQNGPSMKSNVRDVTEAAAPSLRPGDLVVSTQPEQAPVIHHYLVANGATGLRWATLWGPLHDLGVTDWRDGVERMERSSPARDLAPLLNELRPGQRVALIQPDFSNLARWRAPWSAMVRLRSVAWEEWMRSDRRFRVLTIEPTSSFPPQPNPLRVMIFAREPVG